MISIIVAIAKNFAIGKNNDLLYHMPNDMKRFKTTTTDQTIIMGKKTFMSFPRRPLPNRRNIVLTTHDFPENLEGAEWCHSLQSALELTKDDGEVFIIGGANVYNQALSIADKLYLTIIDDEPQDADAFFPTINFDEWEVVAKEEHNADERHAYNYTFLDLVRNKNI